jgi:transmembrane 9 superfamily member 1
MDIRSTVHMFSHIGLFVSLFPLHLNRPFNNPTETYRYYSLPFCHQHSTEEEEQEAAEEENVSLEVVATGEKRKGAIRHKQRLGESIVGDRRETSPYEISFMDSVDWRLLCQTTLEKSDLQKLKDAIHNNYFFEMFIEDLPMWGYIGDVTDEDLIIGEVQGSKTFLFPHLHFFIGYHDNQIVAVKVTTDVRELDFSRHETENMSYNPLFVFFFADGSSC